MNPDQVKELSAFKNRAKTNVAIPKKLTISTTRDLPTSNNIAAASKVRSNSSIRNESVSHAKVRFAILAKSVRYLRHRHQNGEDHFLSVKQIMDESNQQDVSGATMKWLATEALVDNPKIEFTLDKKSFRFKPLYRIKDGKALIRLLKQHDLKGLGGISLEDIKESLPNCDAILKKYENEIIQIVRPLDKKTILFYNDKSADFNVDDDFQKLWRSVAVDSMDYSKIEEHLEKQGIRALEGEKPKFKAPKPVRTSAKKKRIADKPRDNIHVADVLISYDDNGEVKH